MYNSESLESMLNEIIDRRVKNILKQKGYEVPYEGVVRSITQAEENTDSYTQSVEVFVVGYDVTVQLRNLSGEMLTEGDRVRIYTSSGNLANGYIGIKCN